MGRTAYHQFLQDFKRHYGGQAHEARRVWNAASIEKKALYKSGDIGVEQFVELRQTPPISGNKLSKTRLSRVRKRDCVGPTRQWIIGKGCFATENEKKSFVPQTPSPEISSAKVDRPRRQISFSPKTASPEISSVNVDQTPQPVVGALIHGVPVALIEQKSGFSLQRHRNAPVELGKGVYGRVLLACTDQNQNKNCNYAMKVIPGAHQGEIDLSQKAAELDIGPKIFASAIVRYNEKTVTVIVMERFDGTLNDLSKPLKGTAATAFADLVERAQRACLIHKDLHLNNIMYRFCGDSSDSACEMRIIDFGSNFAFFCKRRLAVERAQAAGTWLFHVQHFLKHKTLYLGVLTAAAQRTPNKHLADTFVRTKNRYRDAYDDMKRSIDQLDLPKPSRRPK